MSQSFYEHIQAMRLDRDGTMSFVLTDGRAMTVPGEQPAFEPSSAIASSTHHPHSCQLHLQTTRGHNIVVELPKPTDLSPLLGRPTIYLDQNHWSTLTSAVQWPHKVRDKRERAAADKLIALATDRKVILLMSSAHMAETCKQLDREQRYWRALTIARLSGGWQLRDPLSLRRFELRQALTTRYRDHCLIPLAGVTLEPDAIHEGREKTLPEVAADLPPEARWAVHAITCIGGNIDTMLDADHVPMDLTPGWADGFRQFAEFLRDNPTEKEMKRKRIHLKFLADAGKEIAVAASSSHITTDNLSQWYLEHSDYDVSRMPALGLFREVLYEKLSDGELRWEDNDLTDMMYLTAAAGYCDHLVGERSHASHLFNSMRRLRRTGRVHRNLRSLVQEL